MSSVQEGDVSFAACAACVAAIVLFQYLVSTSRLDVVQKEALNRREDVHPRRKVQHLVTGLMIYGASGIFGQLAGAAVLLCFAVLFYGINEYRGHNEAFNTLYTKTFRSILRQHEVSRVSLPGSFYFLLGSGISLAVFPPRVARLAILHLSVGDPAASFVGIVYGKHKLAAILGAMGGDKSLEGSIGCCCVASMATFLALTLEQDFYFDVKGDDTIALSLAMSLVAGISAAVAELLNISGWDDNFTLPLLSGVFMQISLELYNCLKQSIL